MKPGAVSTSPSASLFIFFFLFFRFFKMAITLFRENSGEIYYQNKLHIWLEKLGILMDIACSPVLSLSIYLVKWLKLAHFFTFSLIELDRVVHKVAFCLFLVQFCIKILLFQWEKAPAGNWTWVAGTGVQCSTSRPRDLCY